MIEKIWNVLSSNALNLQCGRCLVGKSQVTRGCKSLSPALPSQCQVTESSRRDTRTPLVLSSQPTLQSLLELIYLTDHAHSCSWLRPLLVIVDMWSPISRTMSQESVKTLLDIIVWFQSVLRKQQALSLRKLTCTLPALRWNWRRWLSVRKALGGTGSENGHSKSSGLFHSQHEWTFSIITML